MTIYYYEYQHKELTIKYISYNQQSINNQSINQSYFLPSNTSFFFFKFYDKNCILFYKKIVKSDLLSWKLCLIIQKKNASS